MRKLALCIGLILASTATDVSARRLWDEAAIAQLVTTAHDAIAEGLPEDAILLDELNQRRRARAFDSTRANEAALDAKADELFAVLAQEFALGRTDPASIEPSWQVLNTAPDIDPLRAAALESGQVRAALRALLPTNGDYAAMRKALAEARAAPRPADDARIITLRANMERWRWAPRTLPPDRVDVHIPFFALQRIRNGLVTETHKVIVGKPGTPTPSFAAQIEAVTVNPYWAPPASILFGELIPSFKRNPDLAAQEGYEILNAAGDGVDAHAVDWGARPFPYRVRQSPGDHNALGRLKFEMPNPFSIYLHDTPARTLFAREARALSHGCVRVEDPAGLAASLAIGADDDLKMLIASGASQRIALPAPIPVFVLYLTAITDADGTLVYANDIYKRDDPLVRALDAARPASRAVASRWNVALLTGLAAPADGRAPSPIAPLSAPNATCTRD